VELGDPLSVTKGVGSPESVPVREDVRLADLVRVPDFVPVTVCKEEAVLVTVPVLLKEIEGVTLCVTVLVTVAVDTADPVPVGVLDPVTDGL
jgi:hypothetical protein